MNLWANPWAEGGMTRAPARTVNARAFAEMVSLAEEGFSRWDIAAMTGWSVQTAGKHVGHLVPARTRTQQPDVDRYRRMIMAVQGASYGEWDGIAKRFGLKNARVLNVTLVTARRRVAEASRSTPSSADRGRA